MNIHKHSLVAMFAVFAATLLTGADYPEAVSQTVLGSESSAVVRSAVVTGIRVKAVNLGEEEIQSLAFGDHGAKLAAVSSMSRTFATSAEVVCRKTMSALRGAEKEADRLLTTQRDRAQSEGNLEKFNAFETAIANPETEFADSVAAPVYPWFRQRVGACLREHFQTLASNTRAYAEKLEGIQKLSLQRGEKEAARTIYDYRKRIFAVSNGFSSQALRVAAEFAPTRPSRPSQATPVAAMRPTAAEEPWKNVRVDAKDFLGMVVAEDAKPGDRILFRYKSGTWAAGNSDWTPKVNPDSDTLVRKENAAVLVWKNPDTRAFETVATLPPGTASEPFSFSVLRQGRYMLKIGDGDPGDFGDNHGYVVYEVKVVRSGASADSAGPGRFPERIESSPAQSGSQNAVSSSDPKTLTGTQRDRIVVLKKTAKPHMVRDQYLVPEGCELDVEAGATILFERDASLYADGVLAMRGSEHEPIICRGVKSGLTWQGILVKNSATRLEFVQVTGAQFGLEVFAGHPEVSDSVFSRCKRGISVKTAAPIFRNCRFEENEREGVFCTRTGRDFVLDHCSLVNNSGWGMFGNYYGGAFLKACVVKNNKKGGIHSDCWSCDVAAQGCIIGPNGKAPDVENGADIGWDFKGNWWGPQVTQLLQRRGDGVNLPNIRDGRDGHGNNIVDVSEFLTEEPKDCGATVKTVLFVQRL